MDLFGKLTSVVDSIRTHLHVERQKTEGQMVVVAVIERRYEHSIILIVFPRQIRVHTHVLQLHVEHVKEASVCSQQNSHYTERHRRNVLVEILWSKTNDNEGGAGLLLAKHVHCLSHHVGVLVKIYK